MLSDSFSLKDLEKLERDYERDLNKSRFTTKFRLSSMMGEADVGHEGDKGEIKESRAPNSGSLSRDPKQNMLITHGLTEQIQNNH